MVLSTPTASELWRSRVTVQIGCHNGGALRLGPLAALLQGTDERIQNRNSLMYTT
jgi:hypothetical protein